MFTSPFSPYGATTPTGGGIDEFLAKYGQMNPQQNNNNQQTTPTAISELDEFLAGLPSDKRNAIEISPDYQHRKLRLFDKFLTFAIAMTPDGQTFLGTPAGKRLSQDLLDSAQKIASNYEVESRSELEQMKQLITKQSDQIEKLQSELAEQKLIFDFTKAENQKKQKEEQPPSKPPAVIINNNKGGSN